MICLFICMHFGQTVHDNAFHYYYSLQFTKFLTILITLCYCNKTSIRTWKKKCVGKSLSNILHYWSIMLWTVFLVCCLFFRSSISFIVAFLFWSTLCQYYWFVLKENNVQRAYHLYYFLLMLQDIFLFELNFKEEKRKCDLHVFFRPEIAENQLVGGRPVNKSQNNPRRCPVMGITQRNYFTF